MMFKSIRSVFVVGSLMLASLAQFAQAEVIGFEDVAVSGCCSFIAGGYHGLDYAGGYGGNSWVIGDETGNIFSGIEAHSGKNYAWSNGATDLLITNGLFDLNSFWARTAWGSQTATAHGFLGATEVYTTAFTATTDYQFFSFNFLNIDSFTITNQGTNFLFDDMTINGTNVPEPTPFVLIALGFGALMLRRKA